MFEATAAFSGFSVDDLAKAAAFYRETLGLTVDDEGMGLRLHLPQGGTVFVYPKDNHEPATFTILNFAVYDIDKSVDELERLGVRLERYKDMPQDKRGILRPPPSAARDYGPAIAWFKDPAGNVLSVLQDNHENT